MEAVMNTAKTYFAEFPELLDSAAIEARLSEVSEVRQERIRTAKRPETKASLLAAGLIFRAVMKQEFGLAEAKVEIGEHGKPYLPCHPDIHFNLSHSAAVVVCTVSDTECGVDIEKIDAPHNMMGIANRFFSLPEYNAMLLSQNPKEAFCRLWTLRESYVKMRGMGFDIGLSTLRCDFHRGVCAIYQDEVLQKDAFFHEFRNIYGYRGAVCTAGEASHEISRIGIG